MRTLPVHFPVLFCRKRSHVLFEETSQKALSGNVARPLPAHLLGHFIENFRGRFFKV